MAQLKEKLKSAKVWAVALMVILLIIFAVQNREVHLVRFLIWKFKISYSLTIFVIGAVGFVAGLVFSARRRRSQG